MNNYYIITFENTLGAINAEDVLKSEGIDFIMMPTPTYITKSCGMSVRLPSSEMEKFQELMNANRIKEKDIYLKGEAGISKIK